MKDTYYIMLVTAPNPQRLGQLIEMRSIDILCSTEGQELMVGLRSMRHGPIHEEHFYAYKKALCDAGIFHVFHGPSLKQFAENYFFIDSSKYEEAQKMLPETVSLFDFKNCNIL